MSTFFFFFQINLEMTTDRKKTSHTFQFQEKRSKKLFLPNKKSAIRFQIPIETLHPPYNTSKAIKGLFILQASTSKVLWAFLMVYAAGEERGSSFRTGGGEPVSLYQVMGGGMKILKIYSSNSFNNCQDPSIVLRDETTKMNNKKKVPALLRITKQ